jgi:CheY-like chemotaxis protein
VVAVATGEEALEVINQRAAELGVLLSDVVLPGISGIELLEQARQARPDLRAILMSGYTASTMDQRQPPPGVTFLEKPFTLDGLTRQSGKSFRRYAAIRSLRARISTGREPPEAGEVDAWPGWGGCRHDEHRLTVRAPQDIARAASVDDQLSHDVRGSTIGATAKGVGHLAPEDVHQEAAHGIAINVVVARHV